MNLAKVRTAGESYLSRFRSFQEKASGAGHGWLQDIREGGMSRFQALGFPTIRLEDWRYTNVAPIASATFTPAWDAGNLPRPSARVIEAEAPSGKGRNRLVFHNGLYSRDLSTMAGLPDGVRAAGMVDALARCPDLVRGHLAQHVRCESSGFTALNTAFIHDGGFVYLPDGVRLDAPIQLLFFSSSAEEPVVAHPRNLILLGRESAATVVESYAGVEGKGYFTNGVTEVVLGPGARLEYYRIQREGLEAFHVSATQVFQGAESRFESFYLDMGARLARNDLNVSFGGEGGACTLNGLYLAGGRQHIDNHTTADHRESFTVSRQLYKGILYGASRAVFNGKVVAQRGTHQVNADQTNKNLLLSDDAQISTKPQLEIFADDLKCSHGATVGQLDQEAIFYMRSRGIGEEVARRYLTYGFARDVIGRIGDAGVRGLIERLVLDRLP